MAKKSEECRQVELSTLLSLQRLIMTEKCRRKVEPRATTLIPHCIIGWVGPCCGAKPPQKWPIRWAVEQTKALVFGPSQQYILDNFKTSCHAGNYCPSKILTSTTCHIRWSDCTINTPQKFSPTFPQLHQFCESLYIFTPFLKLVRFCKKATFLCTKPH